MPMSNNIKRFDKILIKKYTKYNNFNISVLEDINDEKLCRNRKD